MSSQFWTYRLKRKYPVSISLKTARRVESRVKHALSIFFVFDRLRKFEKTNAKFGRFNDLSSTRYLHLNQQLKSHTKMLLDMKKDLDSVFRRIR